jgi:hypothetical protein
MLTAYLQRELADEEFLAVASIWRRDGRIGVATPGNRVLREAHARLAADQPDLNLSRLAQRITAERWVLSAITLMRRGALRDAISHLSHALRWDPPRFATALAAAAGRLLLRLYRKLRPVFPGSAS